MEVEGAGKVASRRPGASSLLLAVLAVVCGTRSFRGVKTLSIRPYALASSALMNRSRSMSRSMVSIGWPVCWA